MSVDLPALGNPTSAASAMSFSSRSQPPLLAVLALLGEARAPGGGWRGSGRCPGRPGRRGRRGSGRRALTRSARTRPPRSRTTVPSGTCTIRSSPVAPWRFLPEPCAPDVACGAGGRGTRAASDVAVGQQPDVAAVAAVAAVGAALGDVGLAPERDRARAAVAAPHVELRLVDELSGDMRITHDAAQAIAAAGEAAPAVSLRGGRRRACGPCGCRT